MQPREPMRVYVAGSSGELARAKIAIAACRDRGWTVTEDWPAVVEAHGGVANRGLAHAARMGAAGACLRGIDAADVVWLLVPDETSPSAGCWVELGHALRLDSVRAIVCSGDTHRSIFCADCHEVASDSDALVRLEELARWIAKLSEISFVRTLGAEVG